MESTDEPSSDAAKVKTTPPVTGKNTDPKPTPKTPTADELAARRAAKAAADAAANVPATPPVPSGAKVYTR